MRQSCIVSGASGFIGSKTSEILSETFEVFPIYRSSFCGDTSGSAAISGDIDAVFQLAGMKGVENTENNVSKCIEANILFNKRMLDMAANFSARKFVLISTHRAFNSNGIYGASKLVAEKESFEFCRAANINCHIVRIGNVAWSPDSLFTKWLKAIQTFGSIDIVSSNSTIFLQSRRACCESLINSTEGLSTSIPKAVKLSTLAEQFVEVYGGTVNNLHKSDYHDKIGVDNRGRLISSQNYPKMNSEEIYDIITNKD